MQLSQLKLECSYYSLHLNLSRQSTRVIQEFDRDVWQYIFIGRNDHGGILVRVFGCGAVPENRFDKGKTPANKPTQRGLYIVEVLRLNGPLIDLTRRYAKVPRQSLTKLQQCDVILASDDERSIHYQDSR